MRAREAAGEYEVLVDISDADLDLIDDMIYTFNIETEMCESESGIRMWFKMPILYKHESEGICALGFKVKWEIVKYTENGIVEKEDIENEGIRQELPDFLTCIKDAEDFYEETSNSDLRLHDEETKEIDLRKNMLFNHKFKIRHIKNYENILRFINTNSPSVVVQQKDLDVIIQDDKIKAENNNEYEVARQLIDKLRIVRFNESLYIYDRNHYCIGNNSVKSKVAQELKGQKSRYLSEVMKQIEICTPIVKEPQEGWVIKFKNGCLYDGEWLDRDYTDFTPYYIDIPYYSNVTPVPIVDEFLRTFTENDESYINFILETIAHCLITDLNVKRHEDFQRVTFFKGDGKNGKGVLMNVIRCLLGAENVSSVSLERITDERYLYSMRGKLANCSDDLKNKPIDENKMKILKNLAAFDPLELRKLYEVARSEAISASQIFTTNHILKSNEKGEAWKRRAVWSPAHAKPRVKDPDIQKKLTSPEALMYWLMLVINAYIRLYKERKFTECKKVLDYTESYHEENNMALAWVRSKGKEYFINKRSPQVYNKNKGDDYMTWHKENVGGTPLNKVQLKETILEVHNLVFKNTSVNGKSDWLFKEK
ncbi:putative DNA primase/helicase [Evansella caseinilytica]|uniref:Putative DNA primase/helicase n=1 Tax=Evansella caseinilytica TaxID=1503961 RepID=A0A1H3UD35_9BACI|nr:DUF5906 domain-containing protein [Evansella caseinilytica]SDZ59765.1 putative DNA primase/helicase [Evansella caseinilytica]